MKRGLEWNSFNTAVKVFLDPNKTMRVDEEHPGKER